MILKNPVDLLSLHLSMIPGGILEDTNKSLSNI